jgi:hypothetical protein
MVISLSWIKILMKKPSLCQWTFWDTGLKSAPASISARTHHVHHAAAAAAVDDKYISIVILKATPQGVAFFYAQTERFQVIEITSCLHMIYAIARLNILAILPVERLRI